MTRIDGVWTLFTELKIFPCLSRQNSQTQKRALEQARLDYFVTALAAISLAVAIGCPHTASGIPVYLLRSAGTLITRNFQFAPQIPTTLAYAKARRKNTPGNSFYIVGQQQ